MKTINCTRVVGISTIAFAAVFFAASGDLYGITIISSSSTDHARLVDSTGDDLGDVNELPGGATAVGERNGLPGANTEELRYWVPFSLTPSERTAIAGAASVLLEMELSDQKSAAGFAVDTIGLPGRTSTAAVTSDYQAAGTTIGDDSFTTTTPLGRRAIDITGFAQTEAAVAGSVIAVRVEADPDTLPDADGIIDNFIFQTAANASRNPVLTIVPGGEAAIVDDFGNSSLGTGGAGDVNGGFSLVTNGAGGPGTASEANSHATVSTTGGNFDNSGIVSNNTFNPSDSFSAVWVVTSADIPEANGINLTLQSNPGFINVVAGQPNLAFRFEGDGDFLLRAQDGAGGILDLDSQNFTPASLTDGFSVVGEFDPTGWEYAIVGLDGLTSSTASGAWGVGFDYDSLFDDTTHIGAFIQKSTADRTLVIDRMAVYTNTNAIPEPSTFLLATLGLLSLGMTRRRRRR